MAANLAPAPSTPRSWHQMPADHVLAALATSRHGLASGEARHRLARIGPNTLVEATRRSALAMFLAQFADFPIIVLLTAAAVSGLIGEAADAAVIAAILLLNAVIGALQEVRGERAIAALKTLASPTASVLRDGRAVVIPAAELAPGDVVRIEAGGIVPADLRLLEAHRLLVDEAALTGESVPAEKVTRSLSADTLALGDRANMAYKGTIVADGRGSGAVVATGMATELGRIASLIQEAGGIDTPLQRRLARLGQKLALGSLGVCALVFLFGVVSGEPPMLMFLTAVSLAVAAIPEALPAVVTISLALGARKMAALRALVRRLPAVETLGSVTRICADKTGTLTLGRMRVDEVHGERQEVLRAMALCNDARITATGRLDGDPTEVALLAAARDAGLVKGDLETDWPRVAEIPFDADRKCMTTIHEDPAGGFVSVTKGAPEALLPHARLTAGGVGPCFSDLAAAGERMADEGLRVLAVATRRWTALPPEVAPATVERGLSILGMVGLLDPPRDDVRTAIETCEQAGIVPVMITGDHPLTARAVARRLGLTAGNDATMTGHELATLSPAELAALVGRVRVYARVAPEQKLRIVEALQAQGELVAMTGDGVNDAPALKRADIGVAMGISGTDAAREASAMVLLDDNFATMVGAVREGRRIYDNIRRFVRYAVTTNSAEVATLFIAPLLGLPVPLLPIQILWMNLITDSLPGLGPRRGARRVRRHAASAPTARRECVRSRPGTPRPLGRRADGCHRPGSGGLVFRLRQHLLADARIHRAVPLTARPHPSHSLGARFPVHPGAALEQAAGGGGRADAGSAACRRVRPRSQQALPHRASRTGCSRSGSRCFGGRVHRRGSREMDRPTSRRGGRLAKPPFCPGLALCVGLVEMVHVPVRHGDELFRGNDVFNEGEDVVNLPLQVLPHQIHESGHRDLVERVGADQGHELLHLVMLLLRLDQ
jgi:Ca2+-transporting ATPase